MKKKNIILILAIISLLIFLSSTAYTYAKYRRATTSEAETTISQWGFKVNDNDFTSSEVEKKFTIQSSDIFKCTSNCNVSSGKVAPGSTGEFEIKIDYSAVSLQFKYDISFEALNRDIIKTETIPEFTDLHITGYKINNGTLTTANDTTIITKNINPAAVTGEKIEKITIYVEWNDTASNTYNDKEDTTLGSLNTTSENDLDTLNLGYDVLIKFTQVQ